MALAALLHISIFSSHIKSVQSIANPPVDKFALSFKFSFSFLGSIVSNEYFL